MRHIISLLTGVLVMLQAMGQGNLSISGGAVIKTSTAAYMTLTDMNIINNGILEHTPSSGGSLRLTGASEIHISGTGNMNIYRLVVEKSSGTHIQLQTNLNIGTEIFFNGGGSINLNNSIIDLGNTANIWNETASTGIYSTGSGYIQASGTLAAPLEKNLGRLGAFITSTANLGNVIIRRRHGAINLLQDGNTSILRSYEILAAGDMNPTATLRLYYMDTELNGQDESLLEIWRQQGGTWSGTGTALRHTGYNYVEKTEVNPFGRFTLAGNTSTAVSITCPGNITVNTDPGKCTAAISFAGSNGASANGSPLPVITYTIGTTVIQSPYAFPKGTTLVKATASNGVAPDASCTFTVTVNDAQAPLFTAPAARMVSVGQGCAVKIPDLVSNLNGTDNCGNVSFRQTPAAGTVFTATHNSTQLVTITASDDFGNTASHLVTLTAIDDTPPSLTAPAAVVTEMETDKCHATGINLGTAQFIDNCTGVTISNNAPALFSRGTTTVTWTATDAAGHKSTATQLVTVNDSQKPIISACPGDDNFNMNSSGLYTVPRLLAADNCSTVSITFVITGATTRTGNTDDASGAFNTGISTINWTVVDASGNTAACRTVITINPITTPLAVSIPDVWAVKPGGIANTVYIGFGPSILNLSANVSGGTSPYTYQWSTGNNTAVQEAKPAAPGTYAYSLTVTDATGKKATVTKVVTATDVRCGRNNEKVEICILSGKKYRTGCVGQYEVASMLAGGAVLDNCPAALSAVESADLEKVPTSNESKQLVLSVAPNPSSGPFTINITQAQTGKPILLSVMDAFGRIIETRSYISSGSKIYIGHRYMPGIYILQIVQGEQKILMKMIRQ